MEPLHERGIGQLQVGGVLRPGHFAVEERPFEMNAQAGRAFALGLVALCATAHFRQFVLWTRKSRRKETRHTVLKLVAADRFERSVRGVAEVAAAASVRMDIDKTRQQRQTVRRDYVIAVRRTRIRTHGDNVSIRDANVRHAEIASRRHDMRT